MEYHGTLILHSCYILFCSSDFASLVFSCSCRLILFRLKSSRLVGFIIGCLRGVEWVDGELGINSISSSGFLRFTVLFFVLRGVGIPRWWGDGIGPDM